jgi:hypothetical protein
LRTQASAQIDQQVGVNLQGDIALRALQSGVSGAPAPGPVLAVTGASPASLTATGTAAAAISFSIPELLDLDREGGLETLQLRLNGNGGPDGQTLLSSSGGMSLRLVGDVEAPVNPVVPGDYRGLLVIIAQWN